MISQFRGAQLAFRRAQTHVRLLQRALVFVTYSAPSKDVFPHIIPIILPVNVVLLLLFQYR